MIRVALVFSLVVVAVGCNQREKMETSRQALVGAATPCKAPAACTGKMKLASVDVSVCAPTPDPASYEPGEILAVQELGIEVLAKVEKKVGPKKYMLKFSDDAVMERDADVVRGRVCK